MARKFCYVCAGMLMLALSCPLGAGTANAQAAIATQFGDCGLVVMPNGDLFASCREGPGGFCPQPYGTWHQLDNLFASAGRGPSSIVGMASTGQLLAANGDWFQLGAPSSVSYSVGFLDNVFDLLGHAPPGERFTAFGGGLTALAATSSGRIFRWDACNGAGWSVVGSTAGGPIATSRASWGGLKAIYR